MGNIENISAWQLDKVKSKKEVNSGSTEENWNSPLCYTDGHLSSQECRVGAKAPKNTKGRVVHRGDIVKHDSGAYAVFTEQGSSASQMTAAKS